MTYLGEQTRQTLGAYYAEEGRAYSAAIAGPAVLVNLSNNLVRVCLDRVTVAATKAMQIAYHRGTQVSIKQGKQPVYAVNKGGGERPASAKLYAAADVTVTGGNLSRLYHLAADVTQFELISGAIVIRPGQWCSWEGSAVSVDWWEVDQG